MITTTYREHKGFIFRKRVIHLPRLKLDHDPATINWSKPETLLPIEVQGWARARKNTVWSIRHKEDWHYCFANVPQKQVKKWLDYYVRKYGGGLI